VRRKKGDVLFKIDPTLYQATVDQLEANLGLSHQRFEQSERLARRGAGSQYEVGKIDLLSVLQMQARVVGARIAMVGIRNDQLITRVNLHLALGGSFEQTEGRRVVAGSKED